MSLSSGFEVGAKWETVTCRGDRTVIWLRDRATKPYRRGHCFEIWHWHTNAYTANAGQGDWAPSKRMVYNEASMYAYCGECKKQHRFKRVKPSSQTARGSE